MPQATQEWNCQRCGTSCTRPIVRGTRPKWCGPACAKRAEAEKRAERNTRTCTRCGKALTSADYRTATCGLACGSQPRGPLRTAVESLDLGGILESLEPKIRRNATGCWTWQGQTHDGYAVTGIGRRKTARLYRIIVAAKMGAPIGSVPVHHACANRACLNPDHLQLVTHRENVAEMLARNAYLDRIRTLEAALRAVAPDHPALDHVELAK